MRAALGVALAVGLLLAVACTTSPPALLDTAVTPPPEIVQIGVVSSAALIPELISPPFAADKPDILLQFVAGSAPALMTDLAAGRLDAVLAHHVPADGDWWFQPVAVDGLVLVIHPNNPVVEMTRAEAQAIFNGRLTNWEAVGGNDRAINLISREPGAGALTIFQQRVMQAQRIHINANIQASDAALRTAVAADPAAIGYSMMGNASDAHMLSIDGIAPTPAETASQLYPLTVPVYFLAPAEPDGALRGFLAWLQGQNGQQLLAIRYGRVR